MNCNWDLLNQMSKPNFQAPEISEEKYNDLKNTQANTKDGL